MLPKLLPEQPRSDSAEAVRPFETAGVDRNIVPATSAHNRPCRQEVGLEGAQQSWQPLTER